MQIVSANHVADKYSLANQEFAVVANGEWNAFRVGGDADRGYYASGPNFGMGRTCRTIDGAILDLLKANGCYDIHIEKGA